MYYTLVFTILIYIFCMVNPSVNSIENFELNKLVKKEGIKNDVYMDFLSDLNEKLIKESKGKMCDDKTMKKVQKKALNEEFEKIPPLKFDSKWSCVHKAIHLSEFTNPMFYLSDRVTFPPRWLVKTYKDIPLAKITDIKQWNSMYNCCKTGNKNVS